jgi:hypothetical protein
MNRIGRFDCSYNLNLRGRHGHDYMVVRYTTTYAISAYQHWKWPGVQHYVIKLSLGSFIYYYKNHIQHSAPITKGFEISIMVFNATFNNISVISWRSVLLVEETGVSGKWPYKTGDLLKEVQSIWNHLWQDKKKVIF